MKKKMALAAAGAALALSGAAAAPAQARPVKPEPGGVQIVDEIQLAGGPAHWCLTSPAQDTHAPVTTQKCNIHDGEQEWRILYEKGGYLTIYSATSGLCLGIAGQGALPVSLQDCSEENRDGWALHFISYAGTMDVFGIELVSSSFGARVSAKPRPYPVQWLEPEARNYVQVFVLPPPDKWEPYPLLQAGSGEYGA